MARKPDQIECLYLLVFTKSQTAKSPVRQYRAFHLFDAWQFPTLAWGDPTLPSALRRFTSEFGMGSGGTTALLPPGKFCFIHAASCHQWLSHSSLVAARTNLGTSLKISLVSQTKTPWVL